jgi:hypothetical protein
MSHTDWQSLANDMIRRYMKLRAKELIEEGKKFRIMLGISEADHQKAIAAMKNRKLVETTQEFKGIVECGDECRCKPEGDAQVGAIIIGGVDVIDEIYESFVGSVKVVINGKEFSGRLHVEHGWGYSEYTPMDSDRLSVGDTDLIEYLSGFEGEVHMTVTGMTPEEKP